MELKTITPKDEAITIWEIDPSGKSNNLKI